MYELDGICYAGGGRPDARVVAAKPLMGGMLLVTFSTGERRLFDTTALEGPAFGPLRSGEAQATVRVEHGFISWLDGEIDVAPEYVYENSWEYDTASDGLLVG